MRQPNKYYSRSRVDHCGIFRGCHPAEYTRTGHCGQDDDNGGTEYTGGDTVFVTYECPCGHEERMHQSAYRSARRRTCPSCGRRMRPTGVDWSAEPITPAEVVGRVLAARVPEPREGGGGLSAGAGVAAAGVEGGGAPFAGPRKGGGEGYVKSG